MGREVLGPVYSSGLGVADVGDIVYVTFGNKSDYERSSSDVISSIFTLHRGLN